MLLVRTESQILPTTLGGNITQVLNHGGCSRVYLLNFLISKVRKQTQRDDLALEDLEEQLGVNTYPFHFNLVLKPQTSSVKLSMLLNDFEPQFSNF